MKKLLLLLPAVLLTACTDIRTRLSPDLLAADTGNTLRLAAHTTQSDALITAYAAAPELLPDALQTASGAEIAPGHISLLLICGNPCALLETALQKQWLPPSGAVVSLPGSACDALKDGTAPASGQFSAAAETGRLPCRTADTVLGDLKSGSGITALHTLENGRLTLALWDENRQYGTLSEDACRGLALLGNRWKSFLFAYESSGAGKDGVCCLRHSRLHTAVTEQNGRLCVSVSGSITAEADDYAAAELRLTDMLTAALHETARDTGADLLFLREYAVRGGISEAVHCKPAEWAELLRAAEYRVRISVHA